MDLAELRTIMVDVSHYNTLVVLIVGLILFKKQEKKDWILLIYLAMSFIFDYSKVIMVYLGWKTNHQLFNTWILLEFVLLVFFYSVSKTPFRNYRPYLLISLLYFVLVIVEFTLRRPFDSYSNILSLASAVIFSITSILFYFSILKNPQDRLIHSSIFWQNTGIFIFFTGNILIFYMSDYLFKNLDSAFRLSWSIHNLLKIVKALCFLVAFIVNAKFLQPNYARPDLS